MGKMWIELKFGILDSHESPPPSPPKGRQSAEHDAFDCAQIAGALAPDNRAGTPSKRPGKLRNELLEHIRLNLNVAALGMAIQF